MPREKQKRLSKAKKKEISQLKSDREAYLKILKIKEGIERTEIIDADLSVMDIRAELNAIHKKLAELIPPVEERLNSWLKKASKAKLLDTYEDIANNDLIDARVFDLKDEVIFLRRNGVKGYAELSKEELVSRIKEEIYDEHMFEYYIGDEYGRME